MAGALILIVEDNDKNRKLVRDVLRLCHSRSAAPR
jgi:CheY-like chemotaxis protein